MPAMGNSTNRRGARGAFAVESLIAAGANRLEQPFPSLGCPERNRQAVVPQVRILGRSQGAIALGGLIEIAVREQNISFTTWEKLGSLFLGCHAENHCVITQRPIVQLGQIADAFLHAGTDGERPQHSVLAQRQFAQFGFGDKAPDVFVRGAGEKEKLIEIALAGHFRIPRRQPGILYQLARRKAAQWNGLDVGVLGQTSQRFLRRRLRLGHRHAGETAEPQSFFRAQMKIILRKKNGAAAFADKGVGVAILAARIVHLESRAVGHPHGRYRGVVEPGIELIESIEQLSAHGYKGVDRKIEDARCLAQISSEKAAPILTEVAGKCGIRTQGQTVLLLAAAVAPSESLD
jgi:hypothetical protein